MRAALASAIAIVAACGAPRPQLNTAPPSPPRTSPPLAAGSGSSAGSVVATAPLAKALARLAAAHDDRGALADAIAAARAQLGDPAAPLVHAIPEDDSDELVRAPIASPDGTRWAIAMAERVAIHDATTGLEIASVATPTTGASVALLDPDAGDGERVAVADAREVRVVDARGRAATIRTRGGAAIAAGPGDLLAIADARGVEVVTAAAAATHRAGAERPGGGQPPVSLAWHGATLVLFDGKRVEAWRATGDELALASMLTDPIDLLALSWDGKQIATFHEAAVRVFDPSGIERVHASLPNQYDQLASLAFAGDVVIAARTYAEPLRLAGGQLVAVANVTLPRVACGELPDRITCGAQGDVVATATGFEVRNARASPGARVAGLAWSPRGDRLIALTPDGPVVLSAAGVTASRSPLDSFVERTRIRAGHELWWHDVTPRTYYYGPARDTGDFDGRIEALELATPGAQVRAVGGSRVFDLSRDGARMLVQTADDTPMEIRDVATNRLVQTVQIRDPFDLANPMPADRAWFAATDHLAVVGGSGHAVAWDIARGTAVWSKDEPLLAVTPDSRFALTRTAAGVRVGEIATGRDVAQLALPVGQSATASLPARDAAAIAFSPDGKLAAIGTQRGTVAIVEVATWTVAREIAAHRTEVLSVAWRGDGKLVASGSRGGTIALVDPATGAVTATIATGSEPAGGDSAWFEPGWVAVLADGSALGPGVAHVALWVGTLPIGAGVDAPVRAASWPAGTFLP